MTEFPAGQVRHLLGEVQEVQLHSHGEVTTVILPTASQAEAALQCVAAAIRGAGGTQQDWETIRSTILGLIHQAECGNW